MRKNILLIIAVSLLFLSAESEPRKIKVLHPNGSEIFLTGSSVNIKWSYSGENGEYNKIVILLYKDGIKLKTLSFSTENTGLFLWQIPPDFPESDKYRIRIRLENDLSVNDFSDHDFLIKKREDP
jgi:hypothetical protein